MKGLMRLLLLLLPLIAAAQSQLPPCPATGYKHNCFGSVTFGNARYEGEFQNDRPHGHGVGTFTNGEKYVGEHRDGKQHGQGTYTYPSGATYAGEPREGKRSGFGTYTWPSGAKYVGDHRDEKQHGQGIYYAANGSIVQSGRWESDRLVQSFTLDTARFPFDAEAERRADSERLAREAGERKASLSNEWKCNDG